jgi:hypothetical protein
VQAAIVSVAGIRRPAPGSAPRATLLVAATSAAARLDPPVREAVVACEVADFAADLAVVELAVAVAAAVAVVGVADDRKTNEGGITNEQNIILHDFVEVFRFCDHRCLFVRSSTVDHTNH